MGLFQKERKQLTEEEQKYLEEFQVANMDIEGMPGYMEKMEHNPNKYRGMPNSEWSKEDTKMYMRSAIMAGLMISGIFLGGMFLVILFCVYVWL